MATLDVKNLPDELYRRSCTQARQHGRSTAQEVIQILSDASTQPEPMSLLDLRGLGKEVIPPSGSHRFKRGETI